MSELSFKSIGELPAVNELGDNGYIVVEENGVGKRLPASEVSGKFYVLEVGYTDSYEPYLVGLDGNPVTDPAVVREMLESAPMLFKTLAAIVLQNPDYPGYIYMNATYIYDTGAGIEIAFSANDTNVYLRIGEF